MTQLALSWDTGRARRSDPRTSIDAASGVKVSDRCMETLPVLRELGACTARDVAERLTRDGKRWAEPNVVGRRLLDLERKGLAVKVDEVPGRMGRRVTLWRAT